MSVFEARLLRYRIAVDISCCVIQLEGQSYKFLAPNSTARGNVSSSAMGSPLQQMDVGPGPGGTRKD